MQGALPRGDRIVKQNAEKCLVWVKLAISMAGNSVPEKSFLSSLLLDTTQHLSPLNPPVLWICIHGSGATKLPQIIEVIGKPQGHLDGSPAYFGWLIITLIGSG